MRRILIAAALTIGSACAGEGQGPKGKDGPTDGTTDLPDACPGWDPVVAFGAASTPAANGFAGALTGLDGYGILPPMVGGCYAGCTATRTEPYQSTYEYRWDDNGRLVDARYTAADRDFSEGVTLDYVDDLLIIGYFEEEEGVRTEAPPSTYSFDDHGELVRVDAPGWYTAEYDNVYSDGRLTSVTAYRTSNDGPQTPVHSTYGWSEAGDLVGASSEWVSETDCAPFSSHTIEYDSSGRRLREIEETDNCQGSTTRTTLEYTRDDLGRLTSVVMIYRPAAGDTSTDTWDFAYDEQGHGVEVITYVEYQSQNQTGTGSSSSTTTTSTRPDPVLYAYTCP